MNLPLAYNQVDASISRSSNGSATLVEISEIVEAPTVNFSTIHDQTNAAISHTGNSSASSVERSEIVDADDAMDDFD